MHSDRIDAMAIVSGRRLRGIYTSVPADLPQALRHADVVIAGGSFDAVRQLAACCASVTYVTASTMRIHGTRDANVNVHYGSEIVCIDGVEHVESVVVRKRRTGAITACTAAALFLLND